jgi:hypothetical protein
VLWLGFPSSAVQQLPPEWGVDRVRPGLFSACTASTLLFVAGPVSTLLVLLLLQPLLMAQSCWVAVAVAGSWHCWLAQPLSLLAS